MLNQQIAGQLGALLEYKERRINEKWEEEQKKEKLEKEKKEREEKEKEAAVLKTEREEWTKNNREQQNGFLSQIKDAMAAEKKKRKAAEEESEDDDGDDDYKKMLRKPGKRAQTVAPPVDPKKWKAWTATLADAKAATALVKKGPAATSLKGKTLLGVAEALEEHVKSKEEASRIYRKQTGEEAKKRWATVDILVGAVASAVDDDEEDDE